MKRFARSVALGLPWVAMIVSLGACTTGQFDVKLDPSFQPPAVQLTRLPATAGLVIPESLAKVTVSRALTCTVGFGTQDTRVPLGPELVRQVHQTFGRVFEGVDLVSDKAAAIGRYDVLVEVSAELRMEESCTLNYALGYLIFPLFTGPANFSYEFDLTVKMTDGLGKSNLANLAFHEGLLSGRAMAGRDLQQLVAKAVRDGALGLANSPQAVQYVRSLQRTPPEPMQARAKGRQPVPLVQASGEPEVNLYDIPAFGVAPRDNDVAVVIGVEEYQRLPKSDYSVRDANLVKAYVLALGFRERNVELLVNDGATQSSIRKTVETWLPNRVKPGSRVLVYYSGHGAPDPQSGEAYLVPYDGDPNYLPDTGYPLKRLYEALGKAKAKEVIVLLDSCFSGAGGRSVLAKGARPMVLVQEGARLPPNLAVLSSSQGAQISTSFPDKGHGLFTYYFVKALREGKKTLADIYEAIKPEVEDEAKRQNIQQAPSLLPSPELVRGQFALRD